MCADGKPHYTCMHLTRFNASGRSKYQTIKGFPTADSTHWDRVTHICVSKQGQSWSRQWLVTWSRQGIIWTDDWILLIGPLATNFSEIVIKIYENVVWKMASILSRPQCVNTGRLGDAYKPQQDKVSFIRVQPTNNIIWYSYYPT